MRKLLLAIVAITAWAESVPAQAPEFEVASVKPVAGEVPNHPMGLRIHHGTLNVDGTRLRQIFRREGI